MALGAPAAAVGVTDRPVFWAELGLVCGPQLLARAGRVLSQHALIAGDAELGAALGKAAAHVQERCLVWSPYAAASAAAPGTTAGGAISTALAQEEQSPSASDDGRPHWLPSVREGCWTQKSDSEDCSESEGLTTKDLLPKSPVIDFLPGVGRPACDKAWKAVIALTTLTCLYKAFHAGYPEEYKTRHLSRFVRPGLHFVNAVWAASSLALLHSIRRLMMSAAMQVAVYDDIYAKSSEELQEFVRKATAFAIFISISDFAGWLGMVTSDRLEIANVLLVVLLFICNVVRCMFWIAFLLVWKLSVDSVDRLSTRVKLEQRSVGWDGLAREYQYILRLLDNLWRTSRMAMSVAIIIAGKLLWGGAAMTLGFVDRDQTWVVFHYLSAAREGALTVLLLYLMASISSHCHSVRRAKMSLWHIAVQQYGVVPKDEVMDHHCFMQCLKGLPCGVEVTGIGIITMPFAVAVLRILATAIPVSFSVALKIARSSL